VAWEAPGAGALAGGLGALAKGAGVGRAAVCAPLDGALGLGAGREERDERCDEGKGQKSAFMRLVMRLQA
jgi:hypothetical protein